MITLPASQPLSRGPLRGFWISVGIPGGVVSFAAARRLSDRRRAAMAAAAVTGLVLAGVARPAVARPPYTAWAAAARIASQRLTTYTTWVTHRTAIGSLPGADSTSHDTPESAWVAALNQPMETYLSPSTQPEYSPAPRTPLQNLSRRLADSNFARRRWLLTCLAVLRWLQPQAEDDHLEALPHDTYTLY